MEAKKEKARASVIRFFDQAGGHARVAERIGVSAQTLYNVVKGRNALTLETVLLLSEHYPDTFVPGFIEALGASLPVNQQASVVLSDTTKAEVKRLETENKELRAELKRAHLAAERALLAAERATKKAFDYADRGFLSSGSQTPMQRMMACAVAEERELIGFHGSRQDATPEPSIRRYSAPVHPRRARATGQVGQS